MNDFIVNGIQFDADGVISLVYMNKADALRREGTIFRTHTVSVTPGKGQVYQDARAILEAAYELLEDLERVYRNEAAWVPEDVSEDDDEDDLGMGF